MREFGVLMLALGLAACSAGPSRTQTFGSTDYGAYALNARTPYWRHHRAEPQEETRAGLEAEVLAEINRLRANPERYARRLRAVRAWYHGDVMRAPGDGIGVRTHEGLAALDEAIADVESRAPLPPLVTNPRLAASAARLAESQGATGQVGHISPDGKKPGQRMRAAGLYAGITEEDISYGASTAEAVVRQLLVDDGVPDRGHRLSLFEPGLSVAGVSCGPHVRYGSMCVIDLAGAVVASR
jgi:uncharacterized protein YkwD